MLTSFAPKLLYGLIPSFIHHILNIHRHGDKNSFMKFTASPRNCLILTSAHGKPMYFFHDVLVFLSNLLKRYTVRYMCVTLEMVARASFHDALCHFIRGKIDAHRLVAEFNTTKKRVGVTRGQELRKRHKRHTVNVRTISEILLKKSTLWFFFPAQLW